MDRRRETLCLSQVASTGRLSSWLYDLFPACENEHDGNQKLITTHAWFGRMMSQLQVTIDSDVADASIVESADGAARCELIVLELYRRGTLSSGKAAELIGIQRADFIQHFADGNPVLRYDG